MSQLNPGFGPGGGDTLQCKARTQRDENNTTARKACNSMHGTCTLRHEHAPHEHGQVHIDQHRQGQPTASTLSHSRTQQSQSWRSVPHPMLCSATSAASACGWQRKYHPLHTYTQSQQALYGTAFGSMHCLLPSTVLQAHPLPGPELLLSQQQQDTPTTQQHLKGDDKEPLMARACS